MSFISKLTILGSAGAGSVSYWANDLRNSADRQSNSYWIDYDSNKNVFFGGYYHVSNGYNRSDIMELDADGNYVRGIRNGTGTQTQTTGHGGCCQSTDQVLVSGIDYGTPRAVAYYMRQANNNTYSYKHRRAFSDNSEGAGVYHINSYIYGCEWRQDGSANEIVAIRGTNPDFGSRTRFTLKSSSEDFVCQQARLCDITADSNDNIIFAAHGDDNATGKLYLASMNSSGSTNFKHTYHRGFNARQVRVLCDSNRNIYYIAGQDTNNVGLIIAKFNSSGTLQWQNAYYSNNSENEYYLGGCDIDSNDNIYVSVWNYDDPGLNQFIYYTDIIQVNTSGSLVNTCGWKGNNSNVRMMNINQGAGGHGLKVDDDGSIYTQICYRVHGTENEFRRRFVSKVSMNLSGSDVATTNLTWSPSGRINQSQSSSFFNTSQKDTNPALSFGSDSASITSSSGAYTDEAISDGGSIDQSLSSL